MKRTMATTWLAVACGVALAAQAPAQDKDGQAPANNGRPEIHMRVTPLIAFSPAKITVRAEIKGGALDYEPFYCPTIVWDWDDGTSSENTADCAPYEPGSSEIRRYYSSSHTYQMAGRYNVRFRMKKGEKVVGGQTTVVQVRAGIRDPSELP